MKNSEMAAMKVYLAAEMRRYRDFLNGVRAFSGEEPVSDAELLEAGRGALDLLEEGHV